MRNKAFIINLRTGMLVAGLLIWSTMTGQAWSSSTVLPNVKNIALSDIDVLEYQNKLLQAGLA